MTDSRNPDDHQSPTPQTDLYNLLRDWIGKSCHVLAGILEEEREKIGQENLSLARAEIVKIMAAVEALSPFEKLGPGGSGRTASALSKAVKRLEG